MTENKSLKKFKLVLAILKFSLLNGQGEDKEESKFKIFGPVCDIIKPLDHSSYTFLLSFLVWIPWRVQSSYFFFKSMFSFTEPSYKYYENFKEGYSCVPGGGTIGGTLGRTFKILSRPFVSND